MTYVVTEGCIRCKHTACVSICPVDCFKEGADLLVIDPALCIDCGVCVPACPEQAIFPEHTVPSDQRWFVGFNAEHANDPAWLPILFQKKPMADFERWSGSIGKRTLLES